jgi:predicted Zn finger-like uncharacterized protein
MIFSCQGCGVKYSVSDEKIPLEGVRVRCKKCAHVTLLKHPESEGVSEKSAEPGMLDEVSAQEIDSALGDLFGSVVDVSRPLKEQETTRSDVAEWYVSLGDVSSHKGPWTLSAMVDAVSLGELVGTEHVWKPGMADWEIVSQTKEFAPLFSGLSAVPMLASEEMTLAEEETVSWKPGSVDTLEALAASAVEKVSEAEKKSVVWQEPSVSEVWSMPPPAVKVKTPLWVWPVVCLSACVVVAGGFLVWKNTSQEAPKALVVQPAPSVPVPVVSQQAAPVAVAEPVAQVVANHVASVEPKEEPSLSVEKKPKKLVKKTVEAVAAKKVQESSAVAEPVVVKEKLTKEDIKSVVRQQASSMAPCLQSAKSRGELLPGQYTFVLDWLIKPNGSVSAPRLKGPSEFASSPMAECFVSVMSTWKFPASEGGAPIANFPFGPVTVR